MTNRFTKTSQNVQGGIMRSPSDGDLKLNMFQYHTIFLTHTQNNQLSSWLMSKKEKVMNTNAMLHQIYIHEMLDPL